MAYASQHIHERAALPKYLEVLPELPKTAVGKVFKPDLRRMAIIRTYDAALAEAGISARVVSVVEDKKRGLVARLRRDGTLDEDKLKTLMGEYTVPWEWQ